MLIMTTGRRLGTKPNLGVSCSSRRSSARAGDSSLKELDDLHSYEHV